MEFNPRYLENVQEDYTDYVAEVGYIIGVAKTDEQKFIDKRMTEICDNVYNVSGRFVFYQYCRMVARQYVDHKPTNCSVSDFIDQMGESILKDFEDMFLIKSSREKKECIKTEIVEYMKNCFYDEDLVEGISAEDFVKQKLKEYETIIKEERGE